MWSFRRLSIWSEPRKLRLRSFSVSRRDQMNSHKNAPLTPKGREAMVRFVEAGLSKTAAACQFNTTPRTVAEWVERFRAGGVDGLRDRSSRPFSLPSQTARAQPLRLSAKYMIPVILRPRFYRNHPVLLSFPATPLHGAALSGPYKSRD